MVAKHHTPMFLARTSTVATSATTMVACTLPKGVPWSRLHNIIFWNQPKCDTDSDYSDYRFCEIFWQTWENTTAEDVVAVAVPWSWILLATVPCQTLQNQSFNRFVTKNKKWWLNPDYGQVLLLHFQNFSWGFHLKNPRILFALAVSPPLRIDQPIPHPLCTLCKSSPEI